MSVLLEHWRFEARIGGETHVLPDGCRDLIVKHGAGAAPVWFITDIAKTSTLVQSTCWDRYNGFRLLPGVQIDQAALLTSLEDGLTDAAITERLESYVIEIPAVSEALACLSEAKTGVDKAAADLGVQTRSLQRLLLRKTGKTPVFWMRLARVRRAAVGAAKTNTLVELAYDMGYADQSHMTREFRHWLRATPRQIQRDADWGTQHLGLGYGA